MTSISDERACDMFKDLVRDVTAPGLTKEERLARCRKWAERPDLGVQVYTSAEGRFRAWITVEPSVDVHFFTKFYSDSNVNVGVYEDNEVLAELNGPCDGTWNVTDFDPKPVQTRLEWARGYLLRLLGLAPDHRFPILGREPPFPATGLFRHVPPIVKSVFAIEA
jgi:hypothetical protein